MAVGADYGLILFEGEQWTGFPFPKGARRECKDIQDLAWDGDALHVVSAKNAYIWDRDSPVRSRSFPLDGAGGFEELRSLHMGNQGLIEAWRNHWVLGDKSGPAADILCMASHKNEVFYGARDGQMGVLGGEVLHRFDGPLRHLAWAHHRLWIAAAGGLFCYSSNTLKQIQDTEPFGLCTDNWGRLWVLNTSGPALSQEGEAPQSLGLKIERPWSIGSNASGLWVGQRGGLTRWDWAPEPYAD